MLRAIKVINSLNHMQNANGITLDIKCKFHEVILLNVLLRVEIIEEETMQALKNVKCSILKLPEKY